MHLMTRSPLPAEAFQKRALRPSRLDRLVPHLKFAATSLALRLGVAAVLAWLGVVRLPLV
jgi:hypothetical protein